MPVYTQSETTYSITLTGLSENDLVHILKERHAQDLTMKEIKQEVARILGLPPGERINQTKAVPMIAAGGKAECPMCRKGFEPRGLTVHLLRAHDIKEPGKWLAQQNGRIKMVLAAPKQLEAGNVLSCPVCGKTQGSKYTKPWTTQASVSKHMYRTHRAEWLARQVPTQEVIAE